MIKILSADSRALIERVLGRPWEFIENAGSGTAGAILREYMPALLDAAREPVWRPIAEYDGHKPVLVSREPDKYVYGPYAAFIDATGVWRILGSRAGMSRLSFEPTLFMDMPRGPR